MGCAQASALPLLLSCLRYNLCVCVFAFRVPGLISRGRLNGDHEFVIQRCSKKVRRYAILILDFVWEKVESRCLSLSLSTSKCDSD
uniref:Putative secreted protein n=1 Tax=Anopheles marajoara TaxID=58244 RepID=A0A2M4CB40_9DIPT